jgi:hypothetical protein
MINAEVLTIKEKEKKETLLKISSRPKNNPSRQKNIRPFFLKKIYRTPNSYGWRVDAGLC